MIVKIRRPKQFRSKIVSPFAQIEWAAALLDVGPRMRSGQKNREATAIPEIARIGVAGKGCPTSLRHLATGTQNAARCNGEGDSGSDQRALVTNSLPLRDVVHFFSKSASERTESAAMGRRR